MGRSSTTIFGMALSALIGLGASFAALAQADKPIKIGFMAPITGPFADVGKDMVAGTELALQKLGGRMGGRRVELLTQDTAAEPDVGLSKARLLVEQQKVDLLTGVYHGGVAMAVAFYAKQQKFPFIITAGGGAAAPVYKVSGQPYVIRSSHSIEAMHKALGYYMASTEKKRKAVTLAWDYVAGRDGAEGFKQGFESGGGKVIKQIFFKLGTPDFSPYFANIPEDADVVQMFVTGADAVRFVRQFSELGYKAKFPIAADALGASDRLLPQMGDAALGLIANQTYMATANTPGNKEFVEAYKARTGTNPGVEAAYCYASMLYIAQVVDSLKGNVEDRPRLLAALAGANVQDSVRGPFSFNKMNDITFDVNITRVVKEQGGLRHEVLKGYKVDAMMPLAH